MADMQVKVKLDEILFRLLCYKDLKVIRQDVLATLEHYPKLTPGYGHFSRSLADNILFLEGTIPLFHEGVQYNTPLKIWVMESYPLSPPIAMVVPGDDMVITPQHKYVDFGGFITRVEYMDRWNSSNNLLGVVQRLSGIFSANPPLRDKAVGVDYTPNVYPEYTSSKQPELYSATVSPSYLNLDYAPSAPVDVQWKESDPRSYLPQQAPIFSQPIENYPQYPKAPSHNPFWTADEEAANNLYPTITPPPAYPGASNVNQAFDNVYSKQPKQNDQIGDRFLP